MLPNASQNAEQTHLIIIERYFRKYNTRKKVSAFTTLSIAPLSARKAQTNKT